MKTVARIGTFETNSSSQHSFAYLDEELFARWKSGECYIDFDTLNPERNDDIIPGLGAIDARGHEVSLEQLNEICKDGQREYNELGWDDFDRDGYLVHRGILPYEIFSQEEGRLVSDKWASAGGGVTYVEKEDQPDGGVTISIERYDW